MSAVQAWVSPWQVAHVLSILRYLMHDLQPAWARLSQADASPGPQNRARARGQETPLRRMWAGGAGTMGPGANAPQLLVACTVEFPLVSATVLVRVYVLPS